jgi:sulfatase-like protein
VAALVAALALLNASLSFHNIWPTPAIGWTGELSVEFAAVLLLLALMRRARGVLPRAALPLLSIVWIVLAIGHYADVTAPALYGRDINLYWDIRYMPDVARMVAAAAPFWLTAAVVVAVVALFALLYLMFRWALRRVLAALDQPRKRVAITVVATAMVLLFVAQHVSEALSPLPVFATPVTETYVRQARLVAGAMSASMTLPQSPSMNADLELTRGADVFLIFIEAYGAVAYERPDIAPRLVAPRAVLESAIRETGRSVVSAFVDSPTFGGSSWLAHITLMSGVEVRDPETNARLMTEKRETLVTNFSRRGYRTLAVMPGLRQRWPEGAFYGFDDVIGAARLDYRGPEFGWFAIPDQFTLAKLDALEVDRPSRPNLFVFYPTISTHFPFSPTPPYQPDWSRIFDAHPYDGPSIVRAYAKQPDWTSFAPGYVDAVSYTYATLAGYLRRQQRDIVLVVLGDHQPAAAVSGEGASWSVPVHVIAGRSVILDRLLARGFHAGLTPGRPALGHMHALLPVLLDAFGNRQSTALSSAARRAPGAVLN